MSPEASSVSHSFECIISEQKKSLKLFKTTEKIGILHGAAFKPGSLLNLDYFAEVKKAPAKKKATTNDKNSPASSD